MRLLIDVLKIFSLAWRFLPANVALFLCGAQSHYGRMPIRPAIAMTRGVQNGSF
jgi:hypothetical protein